MLDKTKQRKRLRKLYDLHAWVGFQLAMVMFVILTTGTIATVSNEIDWLVFDQMRATDKPQGKSEHTATAWRAMYESISTQYPDGRMLTLGTIGGDYFTYRARVSFESGKDRYVHVDQWTYEVTGDISTLTVQRFFRDFHRYMFMPAVPGLPIVTFFAFVLLISLYSGLKTTKNWKVALWRVRLTKGSRVLLSDLHKVLGLWGLWFTTIIILTSFWYLFEFGLRVVDHSLEPRTPKIEQIKSVQGQVALSGEQFEAAFNQAQGAINGWTITSVHFPRTETSALRFQGVASNPLLRDRAHKVYINPATLAIVEVQAPQNLKLSSYLNEYADPLHFGYFAGLGSKLVWFLMGVALSGMSLTGVLMTWKRTKSSHITRAQLTTAPLFLLSAFYFVFWIQRYI